MVDDIVCMCVVDGCVKICFGGLSPVVSCLHYIYLMGSILSSSSSSNPIDMSGPVATFVRESIAKDLVVIFSKSYCPYCTMAKKVGQCFSKRIFSQLIYLPGIREDWPEVHSHRNRKQAGLQ